jgi:hypothetical protein
MLCNARRSIFCRHVDRQQITLLIGGSRRGCTPTHVLVTAVNARGGFKSKQAAPDRVMYICERGGCQMQDLVTAMSRSSTQMTGTVGNTMYKSAAQSNGQQLTRTGGHACCNQPADEPVFCLLSFTCHIWCACSPIIHRSDHFERCTPPAVKIASEYCCCLKPSAPARRSACTTSVIWQHGCWWRVRCKRSTLPRQVDQNLCGACRRGMMQVQSQMPSDFRCLVNQSHKQQQRWRLFS